MSRNESDAGYLAVFWELAGLREIYEKRRNVQTYSSGHLELIPTWPDYLRAHNSPKSPSSLKLLYNW